MTELERVAVLGGMRIPFCRSNSAYAGIGNKKLMTKAMSGLVEQFNLHGKALGEVALGAVLKRARDFSLARECAIDSGLSYSTPGLDLQRACGTSLEAAFIVANKIMLGQIDSGIAAGTDTSSDVPIELGDDISNTLVQLNAKRDFKGKLKVMSGLSFKDLKLNFPAVTEPRTKLSMGQHCELMAKEWKIERSDQDELAFTSHQNAVSAYEQGFFDDLIMPYQGVTKDNNVRLDTTIEKLGQLRPAFDKSHGTLTAGNSSALTDGAASVLLASEKWAKDHKLEPMAYLTFCQTAAVNYDREEGLLMAPAYAVPKMLQRAGMRLQDFDFYEIHEAFAAQVLCTLKAWESPLFCREKLGLDTPLGSIDRSKLNVKGGSIAMGHPFAATGARIVATLAKSLQEKGSGKGLISICTAGGMGLCAILERP